LRLEELEVSGFRNLARQNISFGPQVNLLTGQNGQGKTSLIEAVFVLSHGKSFRGAKIKELAAWPEQTAAESICTIRGLFATADGKKEVLCRVSGAKRSIKINGKAVENASAFYGQTRSVVFTPDELQIVKGPPSLRRHFVDRLLAQADARYVDHLVHYQRALKSRNKVLAAAQEKQKTAELPSLVASWNTILARHAVVVSAKRKELCAEMETHFADYYQQIVSASGSAETVSCSYRSELIEQGAGDDEQRAKQLYDETLSRDLRKGVTSLGPHRDDLQLYIGSASAMHDSRQTASQGQTRSIALALTLAACRLLRERSGEAPILLLDDVESELDSLRRSSLGKILRETTSQVIITATDVSHLAEEAGLETKLMHITGGNIIPGNQPASRVN